MKPLFVSSVVLQSISSTVSLNSYCAKLNTSTLPTSPSSTVTSASLSSFNCSSGNTASNVDCTIQNDADSFSGKGKYKNDVSTFFSLRFPNDLSNGEKEKLIKNVFVPKSNFVFPIKKRHFYYNWLGLYPWLAYSPVRDGAYCLFCVLFCNKVVTRKKNWCIFPILIGVMLRLSLSGMWMQLVAFIVNLWKRIQDFWMKWQVRWYWPMFKLFKQVNKPRRTTVFYCQSPTFLKLPGERTFLLGVTEMIPNIIQKLESRLPMLALIILLNF